MRQRILLALMAAALCGGVIGCHKKQPGELTLPPAPKHLPKTEYSSKSPRYRDDWLRWATNMNQQGYEVSGHKNPKWDESVAKALEAYSRLTVPGIKLADPVELADHLRDAVRAGCDDPFILYLESRWVTRSYDHPTPAVADQYAKFVAAVEMGGYGEMQKFFVNLRASYVWLAAFPQPQPQVYDFRLGAMGHLQNVLAGQSVPVGAASSAFDEMLDALSNNYKMSEEFFQNAGGVALARWPNEAFPYLMKGRFYIDYAWSARGNGWASEVSKDSGKLFEQRLNIAEQALDKAWKMDPSLPGTPIAFMRLELGQGKGPDRLETWYQRALNFPANKFLAVDAKLRYLDPRWYGTEQECLDFARAVVKSDDFQNNIPLCLFSTHRKFANYFGKDRPNYWTEPQVWPDVKASFDRYFELNGDDQAGRHTYAYYAAECHQWSVFLEEIAKLKQIDYSVFGGKEEFEKYKAEAERSGQKPKTFPLPEIPAAK